MRRALTLLALALSMTIALPLGVATAATPAVAPAATPAVRGAGIVPPSDTESTHDDETLLSMLPEGIREACYRKQPSSMGNGVGDDAVAAIQCDDPADGVTAAVYLLYPDAATLAAHYAASHDASLPASTDPNACGGTGTWHYDDGTAGGSDACFVDSSSSTIVWTADAPLVMGIAFGDPTAGSALRAWWNKSSGPSQTVATVTNFGTGTSKEYKSAQKALVKSRTGLKACKDKLGLVAPGDAEWAWYPWIQAADACTGPQGAAVYLVQLDPGSVVAYEAYYKKNFLIGDAKVTTPAACATRDVLANKKKTVGKLSCFYAGKTLYATWYASDTGVVGAAHMKTTPKKLLAYLNKQKLL